MKRVKIPIEDSWPLSRILFHVAAGDNYARKISQLTGNDVSSVRKQMRVLEETDYLTPESSATEQFNTKKFAVNYERIIEFWMVCVMTKSRTNLKKFEVSLKKDHKFPWVSLYNQTFTKQSLLHLRTNRHLHEYLALIFKCVLNSGHEVSLRRIVINLLNGLPENLHSDKIIRDFDLLGRWCRYEPSISAAKLLYESNVKIF